MDADDHRVVELATRLRRAGCVFAEDEAALLISSAGSCPELERMVADRETGTPLEHVLGWAEFAGCRIPLDRGVFVPRPRSAYLVDLAAEGLVPGAALLDLCCGSGAIAAAVVHRVPVVVHASDIDPAAVANARRTLEPLGARVVHGDLYAGLPPALRGTVSTITIVAPYVPSGDIEFMPRDARDFEPRIALDGGDDGLDVLRRAIFEAPQWLAPGGRFLTEVAEHQAASVVAAMRAAGLTASVHSDDEATVIRGVASD